MEETSQGLLGDPGSSRGPGPGQGPFERVCQGDHFSREGQGHAIWVWDLVMDLYLEGWVYSLGLLKLPQHANLPCSLIVTSKECLFGCLIIT